MPDDYDVLKLENQICFPLYAASRTLIRRYHPLLSALDLTYTQYLALMVLWEEDGRSVKALGKCLYLDSGTLTPLLKSMEQKGLIARRRCVDDERSVLIYLTDSGWEMREKALEIPGKLGLCVRLEPEESLRLYKLLYQLLQGLEREEQG